MHFDVTGVLLSNPTMNPSLYKSLITNRGLHYAYYCSPPNGNEATLLLLHGFPSTSDEWHRQIVYFASHGYGIVAPDMLGAGSTARPLDSKAWKLNLIAADLMELLEAEHLERVVGVGHDWGCVALSRLSMLFPERFLGFVWLGLSFMDPIVEAFDLDAIMKSMKEYLGYEGYAYWKFFQRKDAAEVIERHVDSFLQLLYPRDPSDWLVYMALPGKTEEWVEHDLAPGYPKYLSEKDIANLRRNVLENGGIKSSLNWYISQLENNDLEDNLAIPKEQWYIKKPSFFAVALKDCICTPKRGKDTMERYAKAAVKIVEFETGHWLHMEAPEAVNKEIESWLTELKSSSD